MAASGWGALDRLASKMGRVGGALQTEMEELHEVMAEELRTTTIQNASGRPGPNIVTGAYVSSFRTSSSVDGFSVTNDSPQTNRLEYGFSGVDSAGRRYAQPPYPHMRPALQTVTATYKRRLAGAAIRAWRKA